MELTTAIFRAAWAVRYSGQDRYVFANPRTKAQDGTDYQAFTKPPTDRTLAYVHIAAPAVPGGPMLATDWPFGSAASPAPVRELTGTEDEQMLDAIWGGPDDQPVPEDDEPETIYPCDEPRIALPGIDDTALASVPIEDSAIQGVLRGAHATARQEVLERGGPRYVWFDDEAQDYVVVTTPPTDPKVPFEKFYQSTRPGDVRRAEYPHGAASWRTPAPAAAKVERSVYDHHVHTHAMVRGIEDMGPHSIVLVTGGRVWIEATHNEVGDKALWAAGASMVGDGHSNGYDQDGNCLISVPAGLCDFLDVEEAELIERMRDADDRLLGYARG